MNERFAKQGWALTRARGRRRRRGDEPPGLSLLRRRSRRRTRSDERYFLGAWLLSRPGGVKWFPVAIRWVWGTHNRDESRRAGGLVRENGGDLERGGHGRGQSALVGNGGEACRLQWVVSRLAG